MSLRNWTQCHRCKCWFSATPRPAPPDAQRVMEWIARHLAGGLLCNDCWVWAAQGAADEAAAATAVGGPTQ